jgi:hypothetical protein
VDFDPGAGTVNLSSAGSGDIFVQKLDASGNFVWARGMGGTSDDVGRGIAVDSAGNVYTTGYFNGTVDFDPGAGTVNLSSAGGRDIFVQKLDASGNLVWARGMGGTNNDDGQASRWTARATSTPRALFNGTVDFDPGAGTVNLSSAGGYDIFVQKLDASGNLAGRGAWAGRATKLATASRWTARATSTPRAFSTARWTSTPARAR